MAHWLGWRLVILASINTVPMNLLVGKGKRRFQWWLQLEANNILRANEKYDESIFI